MKFTVCFRKIMQLVHIKRQILDGESAVWDSIPNCKPLWYRTHLIEMETMMVLHTPNRNGNHDGVAHA